ncbi:MAG: hypothetical protein GF355_07495, partial [Candidatus Eisenbacteria bacterium]|nr:hypothetical protein [Candidatus Eisenbacteria bacterium]
MRPISLSLAFLVSCIFCPMTAAQDTLWTRTYGGDGYDYAESIEQTADGGYIIAGYGSSSAVGSWDVDLIKTDWKGDTLWTQSYGDIGTDVATCVIQTLDGGYAVSMPEGIGNLLRVDAAGDSLWVRHYGIRAHAVLETADGGFMLAGQRDEHCCLLRTDSAGHLDW